MNSLTQQTSHLLVISHGLEDFNKLSQILTHYFRQEGKDQNSFLSISNKYYKAIVKMHHVQWDNAFNSPFNGQQEQEQQETQGYLKCQSQSDEQIIENINEKGQNQDVQKQSHQSDQQSDKQPQQNQIINDELKENQEKVQKYDLVIMLISQPHDCLIPYSDLDKLILQYNPQQYMILVDTQNPDNKWQWESIILDKCDNFIQIVKENLTQINKARPNWTRGCLLHNQEEEDQTGIFSVLDRIETTRWATLQNIPFKKNAIQAIQPIKQEQNHSQNHSQPQQNNEQSQENHDQSHENHDQSHENNDQSHENNEQIEQNNKNKQKQRIQQVKHNQVSVQTTQIPKLNKQQQQSQQEQQTQQCLQAQMLQFESVMSEMMSFKMQSPNLKGNQRKVKAQQLFSKMFKGMQ